MRFFPGCQYSRSQIPKWVWVRFHLQDLQKEGYVRSMTLGFWNRSRIIKIKESGGEEEKLLRWSRKHYCSALYIRVTRSNPPQLKASKAGFMEPEVCLLLLENTEAWCWPVLKEAKKMKWLSWDHSLFPGLLGWGMYDCFPLTTCGLWKRKRESKCLVMGSFWALSSRMI